MQLFETIMEFKGVENRLTLELSLDDWSIKLEKLKSKNKEIL